MPQMGPLMWLNLLFTFIFIFILFFILNFYIKAPVQLKNRTQKTSSDMKMWKW
uniref:ATP synthase complex subunit 8 n=1 Tax=Thalassina kelanang TaxID=1114971 RepID=K4EXW3_THAKE|nr:ATP synthase F0 subunit 8 [Thalassina kelanang]AEW68300.1 ATP synthase F0 subunit 8 [Thalassina kelanang]